MAEGLPRGRQRQKAMVLASGREISGAIAGIGLKLLLERAQSIGRFRLGNLAIDSIGQWAIWRLEFGGGEIRRWNRGLTSILSVLSNCLQDRVKRIVRGRFWVFHSFVDEVLC